MPLRGIKSCMLSPLGKMSSLKGDKFEFWHAEDFGYFDWLSTKWSNFIPKNVSWSLGDAQAMISAGSHVYCATPVDEMPLIYQFPFEPFILLLAMFFISASERPQHLGGGAV